MEDKMEMIMEKLIREIDSVKYSHKMDREYNEGLAIGKIIMLRDLGLLEESSAEYFIKRASKRA
ncbi:MAG: hypothetical protein K2N06_03520 [Oscillospiraceae bacterium]|nr:hypothetical protein [Oscillospiraceae bacterium]